MRAFHTDRRGVMDDVFEGQEVKLSFGFESGDPPDKVTFEVFRDGKSEITKEVALTGMSALYEPETPKVKDTEECWELSYRVKVDTTTTVTGEETCHVWPKEVKLKAVAKDGGAAVEGVTFIAEQGDERRVARSAETTGEATITLAKPAPFEIKVKVPWRQESIKKTKPRDLEVKVFRGIEAAFWELAAPNGTDPIRQFVNLPETQLKGVDAQGHKVRIKVGALGDQDADPKQGQADDKIWFQVTFGRESKRTVPAPAVLATLDAKDLTTESSGKVHKGHVLLDAPGASKTFEIELGYAGGDTCEVKIGGTPECKDATLKFVNWRKVLYRLGYADVLAADLGTGTNLADEETVDLPSELQDDILPVLKTVFVEWQLLESVSYTLNTVAATNPLAKVSGAFLELGGRARSILNSDILALTPAKMKTLPPGTHSLQLNLCDKILKRPQTVAKLKEDVETATVDFKLHYALPNSAVTATWEAKIDTPDDYLEALTAGWTDVTAGAANGYVKVEDPDTGTSCSLNFKRKLGNHHKHISETHKGELDGFLRTILNADRATSLRDDQAVALRLVAETGNDRRSTRIQETKDYLEERLATVKVYTHPGLEDNGTPRTATLALDQIEVATVSKITVTLPSLVGALSATKCPLTVTLSAKEYKGGNGSMGGGKGLYKLRPGDTKGFVKTIVHEVAHAMGMAPLGTRIPSPGLTSKHVDNGGFYYCNKPASTPSGSGYRNKHNGHHCAAGAASVTDLKLARQQGTCIMFGGPLKDADLNPPTFCADCLEHAKARKLVDLRTAWNTPTRSPNDF
jgi:hypothetical protein